MKGQPENFPNIPGYHLLEKLGEGGMGTVYRAAQLNSQQTVAIKVLNPLPGGQEAVRALQREAGLMAALSHPGVVAVHACGEVGGRPYLILEYVAGPSLRTLLRPGRLAVRHQQRGYRQAAPGNKETIFHDDAVGTHVFLRTFLRYEVPKEYNVFEGPRDEEAAKRRAVYRLTTWVQSRYRYSRPLELTTEYEAVSA